jgi:hypothetical protein
MKKVCDEYFEGKCFVLFEVSLEVIRLIWSFLPFRRLFLLL